MSVYLTVMWASCHAPHARRAMRRAAPASSRDPRQLPPAALCCPNAIHSSDGGISSHSGASHKSRGSSRQPFDVASGFSSKLQGIGPLFSDLGVSVTSTSVMRRRVVKSVYAGLPLARQRTPLCWAGQSLEAARITECPFLHACVHRSASILPAHEDKIYWHCMNFK